MMKNSLQPIVSIMNLRGFLVLDSLKATGISVPWQDRTRTRKPLQPVLTKIYFRKQYGRLRLRNFGQRSKSNSAEKRFFWPT